jgi:FAD binding domain/Amidohydrolase
MTDWDRSVDLLIAGSGGGGMVAALATLDAGLEPLIVEKQALVGGSTGLSGGMVWLPNNPLMRRDGIPDSHEEGLAYLADVVGDIGAPSSPARREVFLTAGSEMITFLWMSMRDQTPWVDRYPSEYLRDHVRFCSSAFDGPTDASLAERWLDFTDKADLLMYGSSYPHWSTSKPDDVVAGLNDVQREKVLWRNASDLYGVAAATEGSLA